MDNYQQQIKNALVKAKRKFLNETFDYLLEINNNRKFTISSNYPPIDKINFDIEKGDNCFNFKTPSYNLIKNLVTYQADGYGFGKPFILQNENVTLKIPKGVANMSTIIGNEISISGEVWLIESQFNLMDKKHYRLVLPVKYNPNKDHYFFIESVAFAVNDSLKLAGLSEFFCNQNEFHLFDYNDDDKYYLFIDAMSPMLLSDFEKSTAAIICSLGIITGCVHRNEEYILQSESNDFKKILGFKYRKTEESVISGMEIVSPRELSELGRSNEMAGHIDLNVFSNLVSKARNDNRFLRALKIISESNVYPLEIRASTYSVALETVKNIIIEENAEKVNPFKDKKFSQEVIAKLKEIIVPINESNFNSKTVVLRKLDQLNQVTNRDSFKIAFDVYGIELTEIDNDALIKRNDFLHGRIPFEDEFDIKQNQELKFITYKMHFLVTALIMKYAKFTGLLKNNAKFFSVFSDDNKEIDEPFFRKI